MNKSPAFQFYPSDWLSSPKVTMMTPAQEGAYIRLLCFDWDNNGIPDDDAVMAQLSRLGESWSNGSGEILRKCFTKHPTRAGFLTNWRLMMERRKQKEFRKERSKSGLRGAKKRWLSHSSANGSAIQQPMAKNGSPSPSSSPSSSSDKERAKFSKPTIQEIKGEAGRTGLPDSECYKFFNHYESNGWKVGKNPMKNWRAALTGWKLRYQTSVHAENGGEGGPHQDRGTEIPHDGF